ncbi:MAG: hypothetical protein J6B66_01940, partial [Anaerotignum sp.]|nr:hypothetical protein [Anaerotignum sp.]
MVLYYIDQTEKAVRKDCFFCKGEGICSIFIQNGVLCYIGKGCLRLNSGMKPQAGSKRGRPFDFSCSIHLKYGQIVNENLRKFERFLRKALEKGKRILGLF